MTRINLVDPSILSSSHLMAEYRELPRIFTAVEKDPHGSVTRQKPLAYTLGKGHVIFFYDKLSWLLSRYSKLYTELIERGYNLDSTIYNSVTLGAIALIQSNRDLALIDYRPTSEEVYLNMARLAKRSKMPQVLDELASL